MLFIIKLLIYLCITVISVFLVYKVSYQDKEIALILYIVSFIPLLNVFIALTSWIVLIEEKELSWFNSKQVITK